MKLTQFKFKLPEAQVALEPPFRAFPNPDGTVDKVYHRDECRLMVAHRKSNSIEMCKKDAEGNDMLDADGNPVYLGFRDIVNYFDDSDAFIFNDTKVFPARLYGTKEKTDAKIEVFLLRELNEDEGWDAATNTMRVVPGNYELMVGTSSADKDLQKIQVTID